MDLRFAEVERVETRDHIVSGRPCSMSSASKASTVPAGAHDLFTGSVRMFACHTARVSAD